MIIIMIMMIIISVLVLVDNPPSDGVTIKTLLFGEAKPLSHIQLKMMNPSTNLENDVNGNGSNDYEAATSGRGGGATQAHPGRYNFTAEIYEEGRKRNRWLREENKALMECYIASEPQKQGYRKHLLAIWRSRHFF